jgi:hypothetical protein
MNSTVTDTWIVRQIRKDKDDGLNVTVFVYPRGVQKPELPTMDGEKICASATDVLYLSTDAVYLRDKAGGYARLPWAEIDDLDWVLRTVDGEPVQAMRFLTGRGRKIVVPMPFDFVPYHFGEVVAACVRELTAGGKTCKLPGPMRLERYARPVPDDAPWAKDVTEGRTVWVRELTCPCGARKGFALRYLGRLLRDRTVADGDLRQRVVAECRGCDKALELFDSYRNGYNAVICGESADEPPGREASTAYACRCGKNRFFLGVVADYDAASEDLAGFRKDKRSEAYGWFTAFATCGACKTVARVVDYEAA